jgi:hypothetical protein
MRNPTPATAGQGSGLRLGAVLLALLLPLGCQRAPRTEPAGPVQNPLLQLERPQSPRVLTGTVAEVLPAGTYFYARLVVPSGEPCWIAGLGERPQPGRSVSARVLGTRRDFFSRRLGRRFATLHFAWLRTL